MQICNIFYLRISEHFTDIRQIRLIDWQRCAKAK